MQSFLVRLLISSLSLAVASRLVAGIDIDSWVTLVLAAFLLGMVNAVVRPVLLILTLPITMVTLGLFILVINAAMLGLVAWMLPGFTIAGVGSALLGWIIVALTSAVASKVFIEERPRPQRYNGRVES